MTTTILSSSQVAGEMVKNANFTEQNFRDPKITIPEDLHQTCQKKKKKNHCHFTILY